MVPQYRAVAAYAAAMIFSVPAAAEEYPTTGLLYNTKEASSMSYDCRPLTGGQLECTWSHAAVRNKAKASELGKKVEEARAEFRKNPPRNDPEECHGKETLLLLLEGKTPPADEAQRAALANISAIQKRDFTTAIRLLVAYCKNPTESAFLDIARFEHQKDMRTCRVASSSFTQRFRRPQGSTNWVADSKPEGVCGSVRLDRFEPEQTSIGIWFWKYYSRKAITNPSAEFLPGAACSRLDQAEYLFDWRSKNWMLGCDYIEFSPI